MKISGASLIFALFVVRNVRPEQSDSTGPTINLGKAFSNILNELTEDQKGGSKGGSSYKHKPYIKPEKNENKDQKDDQESSENQGLFNIGHLFSNVMTQFTGTDDKGSGNSKGISGKNKKGMFGFPGHIPSIHLNHLGGVSNILHFGSPKKEQKKPQFNLFQNFQKITSMGQLLMRGDVVGSGIYAAQIAETLDLPYLVKAFIQISEVVMKIIHPEFLIVLRAVKTAMKTPIVGDIIKAG